MNKPDYMQLNIDPEVNPMYAEYTYTGQPLTQEEALFIYYLVAGLSKVEAFIKAGFLVSRPPGNKKKENILETDIDRLIDIKLKKLERIDREIAKESGRNTERISTNDIHQMAIKQLEEKQLLDIEEPGVEKQPSLAGKEEERREVIQDLISTLQLIDNKPSTLTELSKLPPKQIQTFYNVSMQVSRNPKVLTEYLHRVNILMDKQVADVHEVYAYFTAVMRGQVKDQFGLDASLQERTRAAECLAKRLIDIPKQLENGADMQRFGQVNIVIQQREASGRHKEIADYTDVNFEEVNN